MSEDGYCCTPDSGDCCGPGSWCCARAGKHEHDEADTPFSWAPHIAEWSANYPRGTKECPMMIPEAAVEAAALSIYRERLRTPPTQTHAKMQATAERAARAALEAAAPHILAEHLLKLAADVRARGDIGKDGGLESWDYLAWKAQEIVRTE